MWIIRDDLTHMPRGWQTLGRVIRVTKAHVCLSFWRLAQTSACGGRYRVSKAERIVKAKVREHFKPLLASEVLMSHWLKQVSQQTWTPAVSRKI